MKTVKILFVDSSMWIWYLGDMDNCDPGEEHKLKEKLAQKDYILSDDTRMEVIEVQKGNVDEYAKDPKLCRKITRMTSKAQVDIVVIGHNQGGGVDKAEAVDPGMRDRTIIASHRYQPGEGLEDICSSMGYRNFCKRENLRVKVKELLEV